LVYVVVVVLVVLVVAGGGGAVVPGWTTTRHVPPRSVMPWPPASPRFVSLLKR